MSFRVKALSKSWKPRPSNQEANAEVDEISGATGSGVRNQEANPEVDEIFGVTGSGVRLTLRLNHGDVMIMHGALIQEHWEVSKYFLGILHHTLTWLPNSMLPSLMDCLG
jgi:hypothetical protein